MSIENKLKEIMADFFTEELNGKDLSEVTSFEEIGVTSLSFVKFVITLETQFDIEFEVYYLVLSRFETIESLCIYVKKLIEEKGKIAT